MNIPAATAETLRPVLLFPTGGQPSRPLSVDSLTLTTTEDPPSSKARIEDDAGVVLATAITLAGRSGWNVTKAGCDRIAAESRILLSFGRAS